MFLIAHILVYSGILFPLSFMSTWQSAIWAPVLMNCLPACLCPGSQKRVQDNRMLGFPTAPSGPGPALPPARLTHPVCAASEGVRGPPHPGCRCCCLCADLGRQWHGAILPSPVTLAQLPEWLFSVSPSGGTCLTLVKLGDSSVRDWVPWVSVDRSYRAAHISRQWSQGTAGLPHLDNENMPGFARAHLFWYECPMSSQILVYF